MRFELEAVAAEDPPDWTREVAMRLCRLAPAMGTGYEACSRVRLPGAKYGEWLYDISWWVDDDVCLVRVPLVVECEWTPDGVCDGDFQKLLQCRAEHRIWIFGASSRGAADEMFKGFRANVGRFTGSLPGDRYLFAARLMSPVPTFCFDLYVHG